MYLCYLDESGSPEIGKDTPHFVFLGLAIHYSEKINYPWPDPTQSLSVLPLRISRGARVACQRAQDDPCRASQS